MTWPDPTTASAPRDEDPLYRDHGSLLIDLTIPIEDGMPAYPGEPGVTFYPFTTIADQGVAMSSMQLFSQIGTHLDAPCHFIEGGRTVDQIDLTRCTGPAGVIRLGLLGPGARITRDMLSHHQNVLDRYRRIVCDTGWHTRVGTAAYFSDWPTFTQDAVDYVVESDILFLGLDTPSPGTDDTNAALHQALFRHEIALVECLINTDLLPSQFELLCFPLPLVGLDGSPVRAVARYYRREPPA